MCRLHWFMIPQVIRRRINETWRAWRNHELGDPHGSYLDYVEVRDDAVRTVADQEGRLDQFTPDLPRLKRLSEARAQRGGASC